MLFQLLPEKICLLFGEDECSGNKKHFKSESFTVSYFVPKMLVDGGISLTNVILVLSASTNYSAIRF